MKIPCYAITLLFLTVLSQLLAGEDKGILLRGILKANGDQTFSIANASGMESKWLKIGQSYMGYKLLSFDDETELLTVQHGEETFQLGMTGATLNPVSVRENEEERLAEAEKILEQMNFENMIKKSIAYRIKAFSEMRQERTGEETSEELLKNQKDAMDRMFEQVDWEPIKANMTQAYAEMFTKEELQGISSFYATPAGQASLEKMPEIQGKTMQIVAPAMMSASRQYRQELKERESNNQQPEASE